MLLAVAEIVFEVIALGFQGVEAFVLDLPARPAAGGPGWWEMGIIRLPMMNS